MGRTTVAKYSAYAHDYSGAFNLPRGFESRSEAERRRMLIALTSECIEMHGLEATLEDFGLPDVPTQVKITEYLCRLSAAIESNNCGSGRMFISALEDEEGDGKTRLLIRTAVVTLAKGRVPESYRRSYSKIDSESQQKQTRLGFVERTVERICERYLLEGEELRAVKKTVSKVLLAKQAALDAAEMGRIEDDIAKAVEQTLASHHYMLHPPVGIA